MSVSLCLMRYLMCAYRMLPPATWLVPHAPCVACSIRHRRNGAPQSPAARSRKRGPMTSTTPSYEHVAFLASPNPEAKEACERLSQHYGNAAPETADVIVA